MFDQIVFHFNKIKLKLQNFESHKISRANLIESVVLLILVLTVVTNEFYHHKSYSPKVLGAYTSQENTSPKLIDKTSPIIRLRSIEFTNGQTEFKDFIISNEEIFISSYGDEITLITPPKKLHDSFIYSIKTNISDLPYSKDIEFKDAAGNKTTQRIFFNFYNLIINKPSEFSIGVKNIKLDSDDKFQQSFIISNKRLNTESFSEEIKIVDPPRELRDSFIYSLETEIEPKAYSKEISFESEDQKILNQRFFFNTDEAPILVPTQIFDCTEQTEKVDILTIRLDKSNCIVPNFENQYNFTTFIMGGKEYTVNSIIFEDLKNLLNKAFHDNIPIRINSAYRSYDQQSGIQESYSKLYGVTEAVQLAAQPGHSEHQIGTAIDFTTAEPNAPWYFGDSLVYDWLVENAWEFGFIMSYPEGKETVTGYNFEPWHWRYVGIEHATNLRSMNNITLREYLTIIDN